METEIKEKVLDVVELDNVTLSDAEVADTVGPSKREIQVRLWKNCLLLSFAWMCLYSGYNSISAVQSSLNSEKGLGVAALSVEFACMAFGNLFTDSSIIKRLGCKWAIALGMGVYVIYMAANFYPQWYTLVPLAAVSGVCSAAMWVAQSTYITRLAQSYSEHLLTNSDNTKSKFLGVLYMFYLGSNVMGQLVSSLILGSNRLGGSLIDVDFDNPYADLCGAAYCNEDLGTNFNSKQSSVNLNSSITNSTSPYSRTPSNAQVYAFCGFCVSVGIVATLLIVFFLDTLTSLDINEDVTTGELTTKQLLTAAIRQWSDCDQLLLIPIGIYNGMDNPFWSSEFTKAYVTCAIGMYFIGYVMVCYGVSAPLSSFIFGWLGKRRLRLLPFVVAFVAHCGTAISLLYWKPSTTNIIEMFVMTGAWGIGSGVWSAQVPTIYSQIFKDNLEAAFSNSRLWDAVGRTMSYGWSYPLCLRIKIYLMITMVSFGIIGLIGIEVKHSCRRRKWNIGHSKEKEANNN